MKPGATTSPPASSVSAASTSTVPTATIRPSATPMSPWRPGAPVPATIAAPRMARSSMTAPRSVSDAPSDSSGAAPAGHPEGDAGRDPDVERVDAAVHGYAGADVDRGQRLRCQAGALGAEQERDPVVGARRHLVDGDGAGVG